MVVTDLENPDYVRFYNLKGKAYANSFQAEVSYEPFKRMEVKAAYKIYDVKVTYDNRLLAKPFVARNRAFFNTGYSTAGEKWKFDITVQWFGNARIPSTFKNDPEFRLASWSPSYFITNAQITRSFKKWDAYLGGENIFNFMMPAPILDAQNPFGSNFDASMIWGPVMGRVVYGGIRFKIK
jgi:outer membrane receptor for ferrienterochelin and colicins